MKYYWTWIIYWFSNVLMSSYSQYAPTYKNIRSNSNACDGNRAALVEHFFTVIFSEFRNPPPVCVCVQMCVDQATYCYPNGCLKRMEVKKREDRIQQEDTQIIQVDKKPMFLVDNSGNQMVKVNEEGTTELTQPTEPTYNKGMNIYQFGDKYKKLFKFRKLPKVQLQYNLREQVKNTKSNILTSDVANNRWPLSKVKQMSIGKPYQSDMTYEKSAGSSKYFKGMPSITPRYFKRDLKSPVNNYDDMNKNDAQPLEDPDKFSLEKLINDLIESGLDTAENVNNNDKDVTNPKIVKEEIENRAVEKEIETNSALSVVTNLVQPTQRIEDEVPPRETTYNSGENLTDPTSAVNTLNDTIDISNNKSYDYDDDQTSQTPKETFRNVYNDDVIDTLSKNIEKLNNTSYEFLKMQTFETITKDTVDTKTVESNKEKLLNKTIEVNENDVNTTSKLMVTMPNN